MNKYALVVFTIMLGPLKVEEKNVTIVKESSTLRAWHKIKSTYAYEIEERNKQTILIDYLISGPQFSCISIPTLELGPGFVSFIDDLDSFFLV